MSLHMDDMEDYGAEAPRPVDADTVAKGSFERLTTGQGAVSASRRDEASARRVPRGQDAPQPVNKRIAVIVAAFVVVAVVLGAVLFVRILSAGNTSGKEEAVEQMVVGQEESISYHGSTYMLEQDGDSYALVETSDSGGGAKTKIGDVEGVPACLVLYDGTIIIPQSLSDGTWDVMAYTIGSGWSKIMDQEGNAYGGEGEVEEGDLEGSTLVLGVDGEQVRIPLVW